MQRREFLNRTVAATALAALAPALSHGAHPSTRSGCPEPVEGQTPGPQRSGAKRRFKLKYAPHFNMFANSVGKDPIDQLKFMAGEGFTALEDNGLMRRPVELQQQIGDTLAKLGMTMGVFVIETGDRGKPSLTTGKPEFRDNFVNACKTAVDVAKRVNAKWMTVVPGNFERALPLGIQTGHVIDTLRAGADILAPHNLVMVLEPLSDTPDLFLRYPDQTYMICRGVNSPACKILYDMYHMQRNIGHIIPNMDLAWEEIAYFQIGDVPGRKEPGTGEMHYRNIFKHIYTRMQETKRDFILGMEHGNAFPGKEGEEKLIQAYVEADNF